MASAAAGVQRRDFWYLTSSWSRIALMTTHVWPVMLLSISSIDSSTMIRGFINLNWESKHELKKVLNLSGTVGFGLDSLDFWRITSYSNLFHLENLCCRSCLLACDHLYNHCCGLCLYHIGRCYNLYFNIVDQVQFELSHYSLVLLNYDDRQDMTTLLFQLHLLFFAFPRVSSRDVVSGLRLSWGPTQTSWSSPNHSYDSSSCSK